MSFKEKVDDRSQCKVWKADGFHKQQQQQKIAKNN